MAKANLNTPITIAGVTVEPGCRGNAFLEVAKLYTHSPLEIPIEIINGKREGPVLLVNAAIHGDELNGVEIVRQLLTKLDPKRLRGTVIAVPVVNVFGFIHKSRYLPDRRDLNRCFPGSKQGSIAARVAFHFFDNVVRHCTHVIDLHTAAIYRTNFPQVRVNLCNEESAKIAKAFGAPVIIDSPLREGSLRAVAEKANIAVITYEAGEALRFEPLAIGAGLQGVIRVMRHLGMLRRSGSRKELPEPVIARSSSWIRAEQNGIVRSLVALGDRVKKDQAIAYIGSPICSEQWQMQAPRGGIVIGQQTLPLVNEGDAAFHIAYFEEHDTIVEKQVETFIDTVKESEFVDDLKMGLPPA